MKILAIKWRQLGDTALWTSALQALRDLYPPARIDLAFAKPYAPLFEKDPRFAKLWLLEEGFFCSFATIKAWRRERYDLVLNFHANQRTRRLATLAGGKEKILHHHRRRPNQFGSDRPVVDLGKPMAANERDLNVVRTLGWRGISPAPKLFCPPAWTSLARHRFRLDPGTDLPLLLVSVGASRPAKRWPLERYVDLCRRAGEKARVGVVYDSENVFTSDYLRDQIKECAQLIPTPDLSTLMGTLSLADCYVGSDSGVKHLACALGVPTVTLFGPESVGEWHFYDAKRHPAIQKDVGCRFNDAERPEFAWCGEWACPLGSHACLNLISSEEVLRRLEPFL